MPAENGEPFPRLPQTISGVWNSYGANMCNAVTLWLDNLVATRAGGFQIGDTTQPASGNNTVGFEVYVEDATSTLGGEKSATESLIARGVDVIVAPYSSTLTPGTALAALAPARPIPVVSWGAASESVFKCPTGDLTNFAPCTIADRPRFDNLYSVISSGPEYFTTITELAKTFNVRQVGTVYEATPATRSYALVGAPSG